MATTSLKQSGAPKTEAAPENVKTTEIAVAAPTQVAVAPAAAPILGRVTGEWSNRDVTIPSLKISHKVGGLSDLFDPGSLVLNYKVAISDGTVPIKLTALTLDKSFVENVEFGGEKVARTFKTMEEVRAAGLHTEWIDGEKPPASEMATSIVVIEAPEGASEEVLAEFPFEFNGKSYAMAEWRMTGSAFTRAGKALNTASKYALREGLHTGFFFLTTEKVKLGKNSVPVPVLKHGGKNSPEFQAFLTDLVK